MKKLFFLNVLISLLGFVSNAQSDDQRTLSTKIADLLAQMPAKDSAQLNKAMYEIANMGEDGLTGIATLLTNPSNGDNSKPEFAINSFSYYTTQPGKENWRNMSEMAYCKALEKVSDPVNKSFIISQLQIVGQSDNAVSVLKSYLNDEQLCDPAARALIKINSTSAKESLLNAAQTSQGNRQLSLIKALGDSRYQKAVSFLQNVANSDDKMLRKVALFSLANIGDVSSNQTLKNAAEKSGFTYDETNATDSYLLYLNRVIETGETIEANKEINTLLISTKKANKVHTQIAAMTLLAHLQGRKNTEMLVKEISDKSPEYRAAVLKIAAENITPTSTGLWIKKLKNTTPVIQSEIITMLGSVRAVSALPALNGYLKSKTENVRLAAVSAIGKTGEEKSLPLLLSLMKNGNANEINAVKNAIDIMNGNGITDEVANAIPSANADAKVALINILGSRAASGKSPVIFSLLKSDNPEVRNAAFVALKTIVTKDDLSRLFSLLKSTSKPEEVSDVQDAIIASTRELGQPINQSERVLQEMSSSSEIQKPLFYRILASIGDEASLKAVVNGYENGNETSKNIAVNALSSWKESNAVNALYHIGETTSNENFKDIALKGFVRSINLGTYPPEQKLLMLRKAMDIAITNEQKLMILKEAGKIKTFNALVFTGQYLDDPALQHDAAYSVMGIALSNKKFYGTVVRDLLNKTLTILKGGDSDYDKEAIRKFLLEMPKGDGWVSLFDGSTLKGWKGLVANPIKRAGMDEKTLATEQQKADEIMHKGWYAKDGVLNFSGEGENICTDKKYGDFEMIVDWKITKDGDAGIYLRGSPQVQIWDTSRRDVGAEVGSGGLYNNQVNPSKPIKLADNAVGDWNNFHIIMKGDRVTVYLNGKLVVDNTILENYWNRKIPIFPEEQIELQAHGTHVAYRDIYIREIPQPKPFTLSDEEKKEGYKILFDGTNMFNWTGATDSYILENGNIVIHPDKGSGGNLYTKDEYGDFDFRFEFMLTPGANNGLGIRAPLEGDAAYQGMEIQILDNDAPEYKNLHIYQYHGSVYGVIPAKRGFLKPVGEWNYEEVIAKGSKIKVILNGTVILDGDISEARKNGTMDGRDHPGLKRTSGHIGFLGHGSLVKFRNIRIKDLSK